MEKEIKIDKRVNRYKVVKISALYNMLQVRLRYDYMMWLGFETSCDD